MSYTDAQGIADFLTTEAESAYGPIPADVGKQILQKMATAFASKVKAQGLEPVPKKPKRHKKARADQSVMGTNDASIVSKRDVERCYGYPLPHVYRNFVTKPKRRSPLIHRGYWFRMFAIEKVVKRFLSEASEKRKVVLNLGCGHDALPFQILAKENEICRNTTFVDVDYPSLIAAKAAIIKEKDELRDLLDKIMDSKNPKVVPLRSEQYLAVGCDLRKIDQLDQILRAELPLQKCKILVVAEVSITYMDLDAADAIVSYAAGLGDVRFCLLEQILPAGPSHPFAVQMQSHFEKLNTPLKSIHRYPTPKHQALRFKERDWSSVSSRSLWDLWCDSRFISARERSSLNAFEPFDEWEAFALFASHYILLIASNTAKATAVDYHTEATYLSSDDTTNGCDANEAAFVPDTRMPHQPKETMRTHAALYKGRRDEFYHYGGFGEMKRLDTTDVYTPKHTTPYYDGRLPSAIEPRMCHTATTLPHRNQDGSYDCLIVGGRASPEHALADCWLYRDHTWQQVESLLQGRYRHSATTAVDEDGDQIVLIYGGRSSDGRALDSWLYWHDKLGWTEIICEDSSLVPRFGASMISSGPNTGVLLGGMSEDGIVIPEFWKWEIDFSLEPPRVKLSTHCFSSVFLQQTVCRFGATICSGPSSIFVVGGVAHYGCLPRTYEVLELLPDSFDVQPMDLQIKTFKGVPVPLLIGHNSVWDGEGLAIIGGGAVCFSFGNFSNIGVWRLCQDGRIEYNPWYLCLEKDQIPRPEPLPKRIKLTINNRYDGSDDPGTAPTPVSRQRLLRDGRFERIVNKSEPAVIEGLGLGPCTTRWTTEYLKRQVGPERQVTIHQAESRDMNFQKKNFTYVTKAFGHFIDEISAGQIQYLRSLSKTEPAGSPANFARDYPHIAADFKLPAELQMVTQSLHSSVLRISGPVAMWLHYDVMANVLCQVRGMKRLLLFAPSDMSNLQIPYGESSSSINVFAVDALRSGSLAKTHPLEVVLQPGDVLFIPPLWAHSAFPTDGVSVAVNIFFKNIATGYAAGRDVYGNRDIQAYEDGRRDVEKISKRFGGIPPAMRKCYLERLAAELLVKAAKVGAS
ncbi:tRNA methyltransferase ppm2 [Xylographa bjoerkii]|nr:tRNA methyltransferase ppm2 [Xylographa bjoerkii]